jgi:hypothetical protein
MTRIDFFKKLTRYLLLLILSVVVLALGNKVVSASDCSVCPGNGICKGKADCDKF